MSFAALGKKQCPVCGSVHDNGGEILLHKNLKNIEDQVTGQHLCAEHEKLFNDGYICLVGVNQPDPTVTNMQQEDAERTGELLHIKLDAFNAIIDNPVPAGLPLVFVDPAVFQQLRVLMPEGESDAVH